MEPAIPANSTPAVPEKKAVSEVIQDSVEIVEQVSEYGFLITNSLYLIIGGMLAVYILHKLASRFLYPFLKNTGFIKIVFGTMYVLILVIAILIALKGVGIDIRGIGKIAILTVLVGAVATFFMLPYLPRLPFKHGHMVNINGIVGTIDRIATFHTTIKKFDGTIVFMPNAIIMASRIMNYHDTPERRIEMTLTFTADSDMNIARALFIKIMGEDERVLTESSPPSVFAMDANAIGIELTAYCWTKNADWLGTRSDLWFNLMNAINKEERIEIARPQHSVYVIDKKNNADRKSKEQTADIQM